ncbi:unnamed protein product [Symbiodinium sp. CCMP2592]|nr:unnamed protein product [Symbiodinium sp. CCMP2592]
MPVSCPSREDSCAASSSSKAEQRADQSREHFFNLKLENMPELQAVGAFAQCLTGKNDLSKEVIYEMTRTSEGFQATLHIPAWSKTSYEGQVMRNEKGAKRSAAHIFKTDPDVLQQSRNMPKGVKRLSDQAYYEYSRRLKRDRRA